MKIVLLLLAAVVALQPEDPGPYRDRLDQYLRAYEPQLSMVVADEL